MVRAVPSRDAQTERDLSEKKRKRGLMVYGISDDDVPTQEKFLRQASVSYPLFAVSGYTSHYSRDREVPGDVSNRPARPASAVPGSEQPFEKGSGSE